MKRLLMALLLGVGLVVQLSFFAAWRPFGVVPNVVLALVVLLGLEGTLSAALMAAVVTGVALDLAGAANFGLWTGLLMLTALATGLIHRAGLELGGGIVAVAVVTAGTVLSTLVAVVGVAPLVEHWPVGLLLERGGLEIVLNLVLVVALRPLVRWLVAGLGSDVMMVR